MTVTRRLVLSATAASVAATPSWAQTAPPRAERTLEGAERAALHEADAGLEDRVLGPAQAPITFIEYASMTCPHCADFHLNVHPQLKARYAERGQVRLVFRHFILNILDAGAAMLARSAPPDRYFPLVDALFQQQRAWSSASDPVAALLAIAQQAGFTQESFATALRDQALLDRLTAARDRAAQRFGVNSTPTLFINGQMYRGAMRLEQLDGVLAALQRT